MLIDSVSRDTVENARETARLLSARGLGSVMLVSDRVHLLTALGPNTNGAIASFNIDGMDMPKLNAWLWTNHRISAAGQNHPEYQGIRVTPNVYTTLDEIDRFGDEVMMAIRKGIA